MTGLPSRILDGMTSNVISEVIASLARADRAAFIAPRQTVSWLDWIESVKECAIHFESLRRARVGILLSAGGSFYANLLALALLECDVFVLDAAITPDSLDEIVGDFRLGAVVGGDDSFDAPKLGPEQENQNVDGGRQSRVVIFTSGSTGRPKPVFHLWNSLLRTVRKARSQTVQRWFLTYRPHLYAGLQVFLHCLLNQETLVTPDPGMSVPQVIAFLQCAGVSSISATPSYWRRLLTMGSAQELARVPLEQITLGGEIADQAILRSLSRLYPHARVVHIYATSELGRCFAVDDGLEGFPSLFLDTPRDSGVELRLVDGELHVRTINEMLGANGGSHDDRSGRNWIPTGDLVERVGDRCLFVGRRQDMINVGGDKVRPLLVEQVVGGVPGVRDVRVYARRSSLVGQMVACEFVTEPGFDSELVKEAIQKTCREQLRSHERPRLVEPVTAVMLSTSDKKIRAYAE
jgi:acyl-CoA synthetase (AMP-forming)/AMP-acid ligase II